MKVVILAGGLGTRISEESHLRPKPMIEIGGKPILWHIMKMYSHYGFYDFVICCGFKGYVIKEYFANYFLHNSDTTFDIKNNIQTVHSSTADPWNVTVVDTGEDTMTGGRLKRVARFINSDTFCLTYGDGVSDVNIAETVRFHNLHGRLATVTAVQPPGRFGKLDIDDNQSVRSFTEKPVGDGGFINGGFFVLNSRVLDYIENDSTIWEREPLNALAKDGQLRAYAHDGFWLPMDTLRDKTQLETLWNSGKAPWKTWGETRTKQTEQSSEPLPI